MLMGSWILAEDHISQPLLITTLLLYSPCYKPGTISSSLCITPINTHNNFMRWVNLPKNPMSLEPFFF